MVESDKTIGRGGERFKQTRNRIRALGRTGEWSENLWRRWGEKRGEIENPMENNANREEKTLSMT